MQSAKNSQPKGDQAPFVAVCLCEVGDSGNSDVSTPWPAKTAVAEGFLHLQALSML